MKAIIKRIKQTFGGGRLSQVVYVDVLFTLNLFVNYLLLLSGACLLREKAKRWRLLLGAALGAVYSLIIFAPELPNFLSILIKVIFCVTIVLAAYPVHGLRHFGKLTACFLAANFIFAGFMMGIWLLFRPKGMVYQNGAVYFDIRVTVLIVTAIVCYGLTVLFSKLFRRHAPENRIYTLQVELDGCRLCTQALLDTGNRLSDCFSDTPVILLEYARVKTLLPPELRSFFRERPSALHAPPEAASLGFRLIPYHTVGGTGLLPAFRPEKVIISDAHMQFEKKDVLIAVVNDRLAAGEYGALLNERLVQGGIQDGIYYQEHTT